jgi:hypothetical protein
MEAFRHKIDNFGQKKDRVFARKYGTILERNDSRESGHTVRCPVGSEQRKGAQSK